MRPSRAILLAAFASAACSGSGAALEMPAVGFGSFEPMGVSSDPSVDFARASIEEVLILDCDGARFPLLRRAVVDFVTGRADVEEILPIPVGAYCGMEIVLAACGDPSRCRTVTAEAVAIDGVRRLDGADVQIRDPGPISGLVLEGRFEMGAGSGLLLTLDRTALLAGLGIETLPVDADGVVRIGPELRAERLAVLREGLRAATTVRRDLDGDGALDPEELEAPPLAERRDTPAP